MSRDMAGDLGHQCNRSTVVRANMAGVWKAGWAALEAVWAGTGAGVALVLLCLGALFLLLHRWRRPSPGLPPLCSGSLPWLGCALQFGKTPLNFINEARKKYGPVFTLFVTGRRMTFLMESKDFKHFFASGAADFQMAVQQPVQNTASISKESFYRSHTTVHDTFKGCLAPAVLPPFCRTLNQHFSENLLAWGPEGTGELYNLVRTSMYKAVMDNLFGYNVLGNHTETYQTLEKHFRNFDDQFEYGSQLPGFFVRDWRKSKHWLLDFFRGVITKVETEKADPRKQTVLQALIKAVDGSHAPNFALLMMWAALANAIPITFWTLGLILSHPEILAELLEEVDGVLGSATSGSGVPQVSENDLEKLPKVKAAILEAIRLRSPGAIARGVKKPFTVRGYTVPVGDLLLMSPYWAHRDSALFPDPDQYKPSRWIDHEDVCLAKNTFMDGFVAFGGGRYQCPGRWFALLEMHIYVAQTLRLYSMQLLDPLPSHSPLHLVGTQQPAGPCRIKFSRRK